MLDRALRVLADFTGPVSRAQVVSHTLVWYPAPGAPPAAHRTVWLALRLSVRDARVEAVSRGGGMPGVHRTRLRRHRPAGQGADRRRPAPPPPRPRRAARRGGTRRPGWTWRPRRRRRPGPGLRGGGWTQGCLVLRPAPGRLGPAGGRGHRDVRPVPHARRRDPPPGSRPTPPLLRVAAPADHVEGLVKAVRDVARRAAPRPARWTASTALASTPPPRRRAPRAVAALRPGPRGNRRPAGGGSGAEVDDPAVDAGDPDGQRDGPTIRMISMMSRSRPQIGEIRLPATRARRRGDHGRRPRGRRGSRPSRITASSASKKPGRSGRARRCRRASIGTRWARPRNGRARSRISRASTQTEQRRRQPAVEREDDLGAEHQQRPRVQSRPVRNAVGPLAELARTRRPSTVSVSVFRSSGPVGHRRHRQPGQPVRDHRQQRQAAERDRGDTAAAGGRRPDDEGRLTGAEAEAPAPTPIAPRRAAAGSPTATAATAAQSTTAVAPSSTCGAPSSVSAPVRRPSSSRPPTPA